MQKLLRSQFRYYRFYYSLFAFMYLIPLIYLQCTVESIRLWGKSFFIIEFPGVLMLIAGLTMMLICMKRYFFEVSGIKVFKKGSKLPRELQTEGLHSVVRHPLYLGTLLFIWGCFLLFPLLSNLIACCLINIYTIAGIQIEERKLMNEFGEQYRHYSTKVPMLIPRVLIKRKLRQQWSEIL